MEEPTNRINLYTVFPINGCYGNRALYLRHGIKGRWRVATVNPKNKSNARKRTHTQQRKRTHTGCFSVTKTYPKEFHFLSSDKRNINRLSLVKFQKKNIDFRVWKRGHIHVLPCPETFLLGPE